MKIFFTDITPIIENIPQNGAKVGVLHHKYSRILLKTLLKNIYNITDSVLDDNGKPYIKNSPLFFSISHSKNIIAIAFNDNDSSKLGLDIEYMRDCNYLKILKYYGVTVENDITSEEFFQIWTAYEAEYKSGVHSKIKSFRYDNYVYTLSYETNSEISVNKVIFSDNDINFDNISIETLNLTETDFLTNSSIRI